MNKRTGWLVAAAVLLVAAGWVLGIGDELGKSAKRRDRLERMQFPRYQRHTEYERMQKRRTLPALPAASADIAEPVPAAPSQAQGRDPVLSAMGARTDISLVFEAGSFRHMPLGELLVACLSSGERNEIEELRNKTGLDLDSFDRIAMTLSEGGTPMAIASAKFDTARIAAMFSGFTDVEKYGDHGTLYVDKDSAKEVFGAWSDSLFVVGGSRSDVESAIDRVEGRGPVVAPAVAPEESYGEVYGRIGASYLAKLLPPELASAVRVAKDVELHIDATHDVLVVADAFGYEPARMDELARTVAGALSAARLTARAQGNDDLYELLDYARVSPSGMTFRVEAALPIAAIKRRLGDCGK